MRKPRQGPAVTVLGFALIGVHGAAALGLAYFALGGSTLERVAAAALGLSWLIAWGAWRTLGLAGLGRLASIVAGIVIVPFTALLLVPLGLVWVLERGVWLARALLWLVHGRPRGYAPPPAPDFGSTRIRDPRPLQRL